MKNINHLATFLEDSSSLICIQLFFVYMQCAYINIYIHKFYNYIMHNMGCKEHRDDIYIYINRLIIQFNKV